MGLGARVGPAGVGEGGGRGGVIVLEPHLAAGEDVSHAHASAAHGDQTHAVGAPRARRHGAGAAQLPLQRPRLFRNLVDCHCRHRKCGVRC